MYLRKGEEVNLSLTKILRNPLKAIDFKVMDGDLLTVSSGSTL